MSAVYFHKPTDELQAELDGSSSAYILEDLALPLYHYTPLEALFSIMENECIWASNSFFLNDSKEIVHLKEFLKGALTTVMDAPSLASVDRLNQTELIAHLYDHIIERYKSKVYVLSLTDKADSLPLWLNYGKNDGYNFKVQISELFRLSSGPRQSSPEVKRVASIPESGSVNVAVIPGRVVYDDVEKARITKEYIKLLARELSLIKGQLSPSHPVTLRVGRVLMALANFAYMSKHSSFAPESEYRVLYAGQDDDSASYLRRFRCKNGVLVPYAEIVFANAEGASPIMEITIGPKKNMDLARLGMTYFLAHKGLESVPIRESMLPLRD